MKRLYTILFTSLLLLILIPFVSVMAVFQQSPTYTHYIYMLSHANLAHWLFNTISLFVLRNVVSVSRSVVAWMVAVLISFVVWHIPFMQPAKPVAGLSVILFFFVGFLFRWIRHDKDSLMQVVAVLGLGFMIPNMAASCHLLAFLAGFLYSLIEREVRYLRSFLK